MTDMDGVFQRIEQKYLLTRGQTALLQEDLAEHMAQDRYGLQTIASVYYDTPDFALIRQSLDKPLYKEKLRLRSYGRARQDSEVYVEIKKKFRGVVCKRRVTMPLKEAEAFLHRGITNCPQSQIQREIDRFRQAHGVLPQAYIAYDRSAWFDPLNSALRVTFDTNIRCRDRALSLNSPLEGEDLLPEGLVLMEVKTATALPLWLARALSDRGIFPAGFSKYGQYYIRHLADRGTAERSRIHVA
ncbi:MAG: polyphosphate polymerase domain-containing protein [Christensenellales bacterium]